MFCLCTLAYSVRAPSCLARHLFCFIWPSTRTAASAYYVFFSRREACAALFSPYVVWLFFIASLDPDYILLRSI